MNDIENLQIEIPILVGYALNDFTDVSSAYAQLKQDVPKSASGPYGVSEGAGIEYTISWQNDGMTEFMELVNPGTDYSEFTVTMSYGKHTSKILELGEAMASILKENVDGLDATKEFLLAVAQHFMDVDGSIAESVEDAGYSKSDIAEAADDTYLT